MPVKRRLAKVREHRVTPAAVDAYRAGDWLALHHALGLRPWEPSPFEVDGPETPPDAGPGPWSEAWPKVWDLRLELEAAA